MRDTQDERPSGSCLNCQAELFGRERGLCSECKATKVLSMGERLAFESFFDKNPYSCALGCMFGILNMCRPADERIEIARSFSSKWEELTCQTTTV